MKLIKYPNLTDAESILARPDDVGVSARREQVAVILHAVQKDGDAALRRFSAQFDGFASEALEVTEAEMIQAELELSEALKLAIRQAYANIRQFHSMQWEQEQRIETMPEVTCWRKSVPIGRVGLYIPGGTAPLFSTVLMLGIPAQLAGCAEVILCSPPQKDGQVHPAVLFAAGLCGIRRIFKVGGAQAIGAMAYGTESIPRVWKIFGPGNAWVTAAKQMVSLDGVAIDMPAGPSEVCVVADAHANPVFVAADLLSQAEHGPDSQVLLISDKEDLIHAVERELELQLQTLPRLDFARQSLGNSHALLVRDLAEALVWSNAYAPEHLILSVQDAESWSAQVTDAGSVFLGSFTPESAGDYASGTNHTLPTSGYARAYSGVSLDSFLKKITFQQISPEGLALLAPTIVTMAQAEGLEAHARAVELRLKN
jgi:histidinol dehydrogenase